MKNEQLRPQALITILYLLILFFTGGNLFAHDDYLLEATSPYTLPALNTEVGIIASAESGDIPGFFFYPQIKFGITDWLEISTKVTLGLFHEIPEFRFAEHHWILKARAVNHPVFRLYPYIMFHHTVGEPITGLYTGEDPQVHTVISQHTDQGIDFGGGFSGLFFIQKINAGLYFSADYSRTELREYYNSFLNNELNKNRIFFQVAPYWKPPVFKNGNTTLTLSIQQRFTIWFDRGFMFDLLHQATFQFGKRGNVYIGGSVPIVGGEVYKAYAGGSIQFNPTKPDHIRLIVHDIFFPPDKSVLFGPQNPQSEKNKKRIDRLYRQLKRYPEYNIIIEGHTSFVNWNDPVKGPAEQKKILIPLSRARAQAVANALIERGLPRNRIQARGMGGEYPYVPFFMKKLQYRNRRVEVELNKIK